MERKELAAALKAYGSHKEYCGISQVMRNNYAKVNAHGDKMYPPCNCGWTHISRVVDEVMEESL